MKSALYFNGFIDVKVDIDDDEVAYHVMNYLVSEKRERKNKEKYKIKAFVGKSKYEDRQKINGNFKGEYGENIVSYVVGDTQCFFNEDNGTTFYWKDKSTLMLFNEDKKGLFIDTYRAIRQMMISDLLNRGAVVIHSSSIFINQKGYLFVGSKRAGKTTSLFQYLNDARNDVCYGSNERTLLLLDQGKIFMYGWPGTAFVGVGTIKSTIGLESLYDVHKRAGETATWLSLHQLTSNEYIDKLISMGDAANGVEEKIWLTSNEIAYLTHKKIVNYGYLDKVIWPNLTVGAYQTIEQVKKSIEDEEITNLEFFNDWLGIRKATDGSRQTLFDILYKFPQYKITGESLVTRVDEL